MTTRLLASVLAAAFAAAIPAPAQRDAAPNTGFTEPNAAYTTPPQLLNRDELAPVVERLYPEELRAAGVGGRAVVLLRIGADGAVEQREVLRTSSFAAMDSAALVLTESMRFAPGRDGDRPVALWVSVPVDFAVEEGRDVPEPALPPRLTNRREIARMLDAYAGTRHRPTIGTAMVAVFVDEKGVSQSVTLLEASGNELVDRAAMEAARMARFEPAMGPDGAPAAGWAKIPVGFGTIAPGRYPVGSTDGDGRIVAASAALQ
jgi:TonB family protein